GGSTVRRAGALARSSPRGRRYGAPPMQGMVSFGQAIAHHAREQPDRLAVTCADDAITFAELHRRTNLLARAYASLGVEAGDMVTIALPNSVEFLVACVAVWKLGATAQPCSPVLPER